MSDLSGIQKALDTIEAKLNDAETKAAEQTRVNGSASKEVRDELKSIGELQLAQAQRLLALEQKRAEHEGDSQSNTSLGEQFAKSEAYKSFLSGQKRVSFESQEVKNTITTTIANTQPNILAGVVPGAFLPLTIEQILMSAPTDSSSVRYVKENAFTNAAAETAEGTAKPQSSLVFAEVTEPVQCVAHWLKITHQLAQDNNAVTAYINLRMRYGLDLRVDAQLISGNGTSPNLSGLMKAGNFVPHGFTAAILGAGAQRFDLIRKVMAARYAAGYPVTGIILNPADWAEMELIKDTQGRYILGDPARVAPAAVWGVPVYQSINMAADSFLVGNFGLSATKYERGNTAVSMFEQDENNVQLNLITIRAERRLCLAVDRPAALSGGDLTPA